MKRLLTIAIALVITGVAFGQADYKHPFSKNREKDTSEKFKTKTVTEAPDYKHPQKLKTTRRVYMRQRSVANPTVSSKHPFGL